MVIAAEVLAVSQLFNFEFDSQYLADVGYPKTTLGWTVGQDTNPAVWGAILLVIIFAINLLPVRAFGEIEYVFGWFKLIMICLMIVLNVVINVALFGTNEPSHFKYYNEPYGFESKNFSLKGHVFTGGVGHLAAMWTAMTTTIFGMAGLDAVAVTAAESKDLDREESVKLGTRKINLRIILLYTLAAFTAGLNVPYTDPNLQLYAVNSIPNGQHSIFIVALVRAHLQGWPHFFNGFFIFSAASAGINALYVASRLLHALASVPDAWPQWSVTWTLRKRLQRTYNGVPLAAVFASWLFGLLGFLTVKPAAAQVSLHSPRHPYNCKLLIEKCCDQLLGRIVTNSIASALIVYGMTCVTFLRFYKW